MIYDDLCYEHEADIFANQQKFIKALSPYEVFVANIEAGNDQQLIIRDLVESYGLKIGYSKSAGEICAISTLESIFSKYGYHVLDHVLKLCIATWEGEDNSFSANILNAIAKLIVTYGENLNDETFKEKLSTLSIKQLIRTAKERRSGMLGVAEVNLCFSQASLNVGFCPAVSDLAFTSRDLPGMEKPHFIGNAALRPLLPGAITGTTCVGRISPEVRMALPAFIYLSDN